MNYPEYLSHEKFLETLLKLSTKYDENLRELDKKFLQQQDYADQLKRECVIADTISHAYFELYYELKRKEESTNDQTSGNETKS
jgi:hypothetical protein